METFYNWPDAVKFLHSLITRSQPIAGYGIAVEQTAIGRRINTLAGAVGSKAGTYSGSFKLANISEDKSLMLAVVNGANDKAATCGIVSVGGQIIPIDVFAEEPDDVTGYVIMTIDYEEGDDPSSPIYTAEISLVSQIQQEYNNGYWVKIVVLGYYDIKKTGEGSEQTSSLTVSQSWLNGDIYVTDCVV